MPEHPLMKSCLGMLFTLIVLAAVILGGAALWYLSTTSEITRRPGSPVESGVR